MEAGFASLPTTLGVLVAAGAASALVPRIGPKPLMVLGGLLAACGLFLLSFLDITTSFWALPFWGQLLLGLGLGFTFVPLSNLALVGAGAHDAGAASAVLQAVHPSKLVKVGPGPRDVVPGPAALTDGYTTASMWAAALLVLGAVVSAMLVKATNEDLTTEADPLVHAG